MNLKLELVRLANDDVIATSACSNKDKHHFILYGSNTLEYKYFSELNVWGLINSESGNIHNLDSTTITNAGSIKDGQDTYYLYTATNMYYKDKEGNYIKCVEEHTCTGGN